MSNRYVFFDITDPTLDIIGFYDADNIEPDVGNIKHLLIDQTYEWWEYKISYISPNYIANYNADNINPELIIEDNDVYFNSKVYSQGKITISNEPFNSLIHYQFSNLTNTSSLTNLGSLLSDADLIISSSNDITRQTSISGYNTYCYNIQNSLSSYIYRSSLPLGSVFSLNNFNKNNFE